MRIDGTILNSLVQSSTALTLRQAQISQQLSSGVRLSALSDDPIAAGQSASLTASLSQADSFLTSANTVLSRSQASDTALGSVVLQLTSAVSIAINGANATSNVSDRAALAQQLTSIRDGVLSLANSSYGGNYLFAGSNSATAPFTQSAGGAITYNGDAQTSSLLLEDGGTLSTGLAGSAVFTNTAAPVFGALQTVITALGSGTAPPGSAVSALRDSLNNVITQRSALNANTRRLNSEVSYTTNQKTDTEATQTRLLSNDTVSLATQLSATETQQSALLSTLSVLQKKSLFDYL